MICIIYYLSINIFKKFFYFFFLLLLSFGWLSLVIISFSSFVLLCASILDFWLVVARGLCLTYCVWKSPLWAGISSPTFNSTVSVHFFLSLVVYYWLSYSYSYCWFCIPLVILLRLFFSVFLFPVDFLSAFFF